LPNVFARSGGILLETSSLVTLHSLNFLGRLTDAYSLILVTQQTLDALIETAAEIYPEKQSGHVVSDSPGHVRVVDHAAEDIAREKTFYDEILQFLNTKCCIVAPSAPSALTEFENVTVKEMLGSVALSAVATSNGSGCLMISDDLQLRRLAQGAHGVAGAGSLSLLRDLRRRTILSSDEYHKAVQWLVEHQMSFVSIGKDDLIWALRQSDWSPSPAVARSFHVLAGPDCESNAALSIGIEILHEIWSEPNVSTTKQLLSDLLLQSLVAGRISYKVIQVLQSLNVKRSRLWTPATAEIQRVLQSWRERR